MMAKELLESLLDPGQTEAMVDKLVELMSDKTGNKEVVDAMLATDSSRIIKELLAQMRTQRVKFFAECLKNSDLRERLTDEKTILQLLAALEDTEESELLMQICRALGNLCFDNDQAREIILANRGLEILLQLIGKIHKLQSAGSPVEEQCAIVVMGCLFNVADNELCQAKLKTMSILPLLMDSVLLLPGDAGSHAANLLFNLSDCEEWHEQFMANLAALMALIGGVKDTEMLEVLVEVMQCLFNRAETQQRMEMLNAGLWSRLENMLGTQPALVKTACELLVLILTDDKCMNKLFGAGTAPEYKAVKLWLKSGDEELRTSAALAIGNFARGDELCVALVRDGVSSQLIGMLDGKMSEGLEHAVLSALRNLLIPRENKKTLVQQGIVDKLLSLLPIESYAVAFKFLGCVRMLADRQPEMALSLGSNKKMVKAVVEWSKVEIHTGVKSEAMRVICWILKNNSTESVKTTVAAEGAIPAVAEMLKSEHNVMQNEALIGLSLLANGTPCEVVAAALKDSLSSVCTSLAEIIRANLRSNTGAANEFLENVVTLVINLSLVGDEFKAKMADEVKQPLTELSSRTRHVPVKDKACKALHILSERGHSR